MIKFVWKRVIWSSYKRFIAAQDAVHKDLYSESDPHDVAQLHRWKAIYSKLWFYGVKRGYFNLKKHNCDTGLDVNRLACFLPGHSKEEIGALFMATKYPGSIRSIRCWGGLSYFSKTHCLNKGEMLWSRFCSGLASLKKRLVKILSTG